MIAALKRMWSVRFRARKYKETEKPYNSVIQNCYSAEFPLLDAVFLFSHVSLECQAKVDYASAIDMHAGHTL